MLLGNFRQAMMEADFAYLTMAIDYPEAVANILEEPAIESRQEYSLITTLVRSREFAWFQYQNGIMDETTFKSYMSTLSGVGSHGRTCRGAPGAGRGAPPAQ
jgi:hypothetical protein